MPKVVAVVGDGLMRPAFFEEALVAAAGEGALDIRARELPWPDVPLQNGEAGGPLAALREFVGDPADLADLVAGAEILVTQLAPVSGWLLDQAPGLRLVVVSRGGPVNVDREAARERGVAVVNTPGRNASAVAEFTVGMILAGTRMITRGHTALAGGVWRGDLYRTDICGPELSECVVGLVGYSHIGARVARLLRPFGCRIVVADPYVRLRDEDLEAGIERVDLDVLLARSDIVSLHARLTPETDRLMNAERLGRMKRGAYLVNTARGAMVDEAALYDALTSGHLRGAMLDTFSPEPPAKDSPLLGLETVTLTPHIAGASITTARIAAGMAAAEVGRYLRGEPFANPC